MSPRGSAGGGSGDRATATEGVRPWPADWETRAAATTESQSSAPSHEAGPSVPLPPEAYPSQREERPTVQQATVDEVLPQFETRQHEVPAAPTGKPPRPFGLPDLIFDVKSSEPDIYAATPQFETQFRDCLDALKKTREATVEDMKKKRKPNPKWTTEDDLCEDIERDFLWVDYSKSIDDFIETEGWSVQLMAELLS